MTGKTDTPRQLYLWCKALLQGAGIENPGMEAALLCESFLSLDRAGLALHGEEPCPGPCREAFMRAARERAGRRPLQYILGRWEFMGLTLEVGEGVLVPREDTAALVEALSRQLPEREGLWGVDLCAGTGAVALGLCSLCPGLRMACIELSPEAFPYLEKNLRAYPQYPVEALLGDVLSPQTRQKFRGLDVIAANPPYIPQSVLPTLQPEVRREPLLALDGGPDGLLFYRAIAKGWVPLLNPGGVLGVEIGEDQGEAVMALFKDAGLSRVSLHKDWAGLPRAVTALAP